MSPRRPDASMDLLKQVERDAYEPEYRDHAARRSAEPRPLPAVGRFRLAGLGFMMVGTLLALATVQTNRQAPEATLERNHLVGQIRAAQQDQARLREQVAGLNADITRLGAAAQPQTETGLVEQQALAGLSPVTGPGVVVTVDDAHPDSPDAVHVTDQDLRQVVNGLWGVGAEAVAVNGHRITSRTAIRQAGSAITVDYTSITRPYRVEAIGDPNSLPGEFAASPGGRRWSFLRANLGLGYVVTSATELRLPGDPTARVSVAKVAR